MSKKTAIIQFPGSNCERETQVAARLNQGEADILRWNVSAEVFHQYDAYILAGGFSYQDRVRAGAISAKLPILQLLQEANTAQKPILGICNGCQILAEAGLIPDLSNDQKLDVALDKNMADTQYMGFICDWVFVRIQAPEQNVWTRCFKAGTILPIPVNHGEGRFVFSENCSEDSIQSLAHIQYCDPKGNAISKFPVNPNGSGLNIAGIGNKAGNVFAIMPHPERASFKKQVPEWVQSIDESCPTWAPFFEAI